MPLFGFASAASRDSSVQAANKQRQGDAYRALALSVRAIRKDMRIAKLLLAFFLWFSDSLNATPNLFVDLEKITLSSNKLTLTIVREAYSDRVERIEVISPSKKFTIESALFKQAYGVNLQAVKLTQTVDLDLGLLEDYQLYIPYGFHSEDGAEPPEDKKFETREMVIYFDNVHAIKIVKKVV